MLLSTSLIAEQTFHGEIEKIEIVNYASGAAYITIDGAAFSECEVKTNWCAIDFSLPAANHMFSAALATKMAGKNTRITSDGCWNTKYPRCWKVRVIE